MFIGAFTPQADMKKIGKREAILSLLENLSEEGIRHDEFTTSDYLDACQEKGIRMDDRKCLKRLSKMVRDGILEKRKVLHQSRIMNAYRKK